MSLAGDGAGVYLAILVAVFLAHEPWRWLGLWLGAEIDAESEVFRWVRAVATALVAALVMRIVVFAPGALAGVGLWLRLAALTVCLAIFLAARRNMGLGLLGGTIVMVMGKLGFG